MKKKLLLFMVLFSFLPLVVHALSREEMHLLSLQDVLSIDIPTGYSAFQGMAITNQYIVISANKSDDSEAALLVYNRSNYDFVTKIEHLPFGHANDITYDEATNEILVINGRNLFVLDGDTFEQKGKKTLEMASGGVSKRDGKYIVLSSKKMYVYNEELELQHTFAADTNLITQGISYYDGLIFYPCYENGGINTYEPYYDGVLDAGDNVIYVYSVDGMLQTTFYLPTGYGEIESLDFFNGRCYILFNGPNSGKGTLYTFSYENHVTASTNISINFDDRAFPVSSSFKANVFEGENLMKTVPMMDGMYQLTFDFYSPGIYEYRINQVRESNYISYDDKDIFVTFLVNYDLMTNEMQVSQLSTDLPPFENEVNRENMACEEISGIYYDKNGNVTNREEFVNACHVVENPQTGFPVPTVVVASGCIICSAFFILLCGRKLIYQI